MSLWLFPLFKQPYVIDEAAFPYAANGVSHTGTPYFYNGETRPSDLGTWHPPLYVYLLGFWIHTFGMSSISVRSFSAVCLCLTGILIFRTMQIFKPHRQNNANLAVFFYTSNYFVLQSALVPDIDGTLLPVFIALTIYLYTRYFFNKQNPRLGDYVLITLSVGLGFSTKLTTPLALLPLFLYLDYAKYKKSFLSIARTAIIGLGGISFFLLWWLPIAKLSDLNWKAPFEFTFTSFTGKSSHNSISSLVGSVFSMPNSAISWVSPLVLVLFAVFVTRIFLMDKGDTRTYLIGLSLFIILVWSTYNSVTGAPFTFPKYWNIPLIPISIFVSALIPKNVPGAKIDKFAWPSLLSSIFLFMNYRQISNVLEKERVFTAFGVRAIPFYLISIFVFFCWYFFRVKSTLWVSIYIALVSVTILNSLSINALMGKQHFSTRYYFGERGESQVLSWLKTHSNSSDKLFSAKDIGLQSGLKFYEDAYLLGSYTPADLLSYLLRSDVSIIVVREMWDYSPSVYPEYFSVLNSRYKLVPEGSFGDFQIWRRLN